MDVSVWIGNVAKKCSTFIYSYPQDVQTKYNSPAGLRLLQMPLPGSIFSWSIGVFTHGFEISLSLCWKVQLDLSLSPVSFTHFTHTLSLSLCPPLFYTDSVSLSLMSPIYFSPGRYFVKNLTTVKNLRKKSGSRFWCKSVLSKSAFRVRFWANVQIQVQNSHTYC